MKKILYLVSIISLCCCNNKSTIYESILERNYNDMVYNNAENFCLDSMQILTTYYKENNIYDKYCYCNTLMGCYFCGIEDYDNAFKVLKTAEEYLDNYPKLGPAIYYNLFEVFKPINKNIAKEYLEKSYSQAINFNDTLFIGLYYYNLSLEYKDSTQAYFNKCLTLLDNYRDLAIYDYVNVYWVINNDSPSAIIQHAVPYFNKYDDYHILKNIISSYIELDLLDSASYYLKILNKYPNERINYHILLSKLFEAQNDYPKAYMEICTAKTINDSIIDDQLASHMEMWHNEYSKEEIIKNQKNKYLIIFIIIVLLLLITITILSIYIYKKNQQLKIIKSQIDINNKNLTKKNNILPNHMYIKK